MSELFLNAIINACYLYAKREVYKYLFYIKYTCPVIIIIIFINKNLFEINTPIQVLKPNSRIEVSVNPTGITTTELNLKLKTNTIININLILIISDIIFNYLLTFQVLFY